MAGPGLGTDGVTFPTTLNNLLGTKFKVVTGYRSGAEMTLAVERKEVEGRGSWSWASFRKDGMTMLKRGELTHAGADGGREIAGNPGGPAGDGLRQDRGAAAGALATARRAGDGVAGVCAARGAAGARGAAANSYLAMLKDPETLADAKKLGVDVDPVAGEAIAAMLKRVDATPPAVLEKVRELAGRK